MAAIAERLCLDESMRLWEESRGLIPNGTQTFSKGPTQYPFGACPVYLRKGRGAYVEDVDGNRYIDCGMGLHSVILGYAHPRVVERVKAAVEEGVNFTLSHPLEVRVAGELRRLIPSAEMVRFVKTGSEATSAAVKIARAKTGREHVALCGYHGWHDWALGATEKKNGIPRSTVELVHKFAYNDLASLERIFEAHKGEMAAVVLEPCGVKPPAPGFLEGCRRLSAQNGAALIFDEIITGMRWAKGGAQSLFNVTPDISTFGKSIANGMPLAAVVGKKEFMEVLETQDVFLSTTFGGETASLAACLATIEVIEKEDVVKRIWTAGEGLMDGLRATIEKLGLKGMVEVDGFPCRPVIAFKAHDGIDPLLVKSFVQQECAKRGLLFAGYFAISLAHDAEVMAETLRIMEEALSVVSTNATRERLQAMLEGAVVSPVFRSL